METRFDVEGGMGGISKGVSLVVPPAFVGRLGFGIVVGRFGNSLEALWGPLQAA